MSPSSVFCVLLVCLLWLYCQLTFWALFFWVIPSPQSLFYSSLQTIHTVIWSVCVVASDACIYIFTLDRSSIVPSALPAPSSPPCVLLCNRRKGESSLTQTNTVTHLRTHFEHCWYMCRHCACTSSAITTHTSASALWRHNLVFCKMGSLWRQTGKVCEYKGAELVWAASVYLSSCCLWVCTCMLTPVCSALSFNSPSSFIQSLQRKWRGVSATHASPLWNLKYSNE